MMDLLGEGGPSQDEILAGAKQALADTERPVGARSGGKIRAASMGERMKSMAQEYTPDVISKLLWPVAKAASIPASFAGGGLGVAGSVPMAMEALGDFADDPSLMGAAGVGLMAMPGVSALRGGARAARGAAAASEAGGVAEGLFRGTGLRRAKNIPYQYPAGRPAIQALDDSMMTGSRSSMGGVDEIPFKPSAPQAPGLPREQRAAYDDFIDLGDISSGSSKATRAPMGRGSRPSTREFATELDSVNSLSEQDIAELLDAISWARR